MKKLFTGVRRPVFAEIRTPPLCVNAWRHHYDGSFNVTSASIDCTVHANVVLLCIVCGSIKAFFLLLSGNWRFCIWSKQSLTSNVSNLLLTKCERCTFCTFRLSSAKFCKISRLLVFFVLVFNANAWPQYVRHFSTKQKFVAKFLVVRMRFHRYQSPGCDTLKNHSATSDVTVQWYCLATNPSSRPV